MNFSTTIGVLYIVLQVVEQYWGKRISLNRNFLIRYCCVHCGCTLLVLSVAHHRKEGRSE